MLSTLADEQAKKVLQRISAYSRTWADKPTNVQEELRVQAEANASPTKGHVVPCPSCQSKSLVTGEEIRELPPRLEEEELVKRRIILPTKFICTACGLSIDGHAQLDAVGLGGQFTETTRFDPLAYYAEKFFDDDGSYMNE